jgi:hypothetical protein
LSTAALANGRAFLGLISHVRYQHGDDAFDAALHAMPPVTQEVFRKRIMHSRTYPYAAYAGFLQGLESSFGRGNPGYCKSLGLHSGKRDINTVFKIYLAIASTERLIRSCTKVWASYYENAGAMEAVAWTPADTTLRITGFPQMVPQHCRLMEGWMIATMNALGADVSEDAAETACCSRGDAVHEFRCKWTKR